MPAIRPSRSHRKPLAAAVLGGLLLGLATPPFNAWALVLPALGLLRLSFHWATSGGLAAQAGFVWAMMGGLVGLRFVPSVVDRFSALGLSGGTVAWILLAALQAVAWGGAAAIATVLERRWRVPGPVAFAISVYVAVSLPAVFPWTPAALMSPWLASIQLAEFVGERGLSFLFALTTAWLVQPVLSGVRWWLHAGAGLVAVGGMTLYGQWRLATPMTQAPISMRIGLVQPMLQAHRHRSSRDKYFALRTLQRLTRIAEDRGAELVIWPEAAYPYPLPHGASQAPGGERQILAAGSRGPLLFGAVTESGGSRYNSALTLARNGILSPPQPKLRPLWFGEAVPMADTFPSLTRLSPRAIRAGQDAVLQRAGAARIGVLNCYEDTLPDTARRIAMAGPNLLVNVTNDAWFEGTWESELHLLLSVMRAVESRLDLVRAVNGGAAAWVDATGRIRARGMAEDESALLVTPALREHSPTWFVRFGNAPLLLAMLGLAAYLALRAVLQNGTAKPIGPKVECPPPDDSPAQRPAANTSLRG